MIVVDASVVLKWFVEEPLHSEARHIFKYQLDIQAPDIILVEVANGARKKATRGEIDFEHARKIVELVFESIPTLIPASQILRQAMGLALELRHPIYDCLYLACVTDLHDGLVTADKEFFDKVKQTGYRESIRFLDDPELALPLFLSLQKAGEIANLSDLLREAHGNISKLLQSNDPAEFLPVFDSPNERRLYALLQSLSVEELADVLALGRIGQGQEGIDWVKIRNQARANIQDNDSDFLRKVEVMTIYLQRGLDVLRDQK